MAKFHNNEAARQTAFLDWHRKWMLFELERHKGGSTSSGGQEKHRNGGEYVMFGGDTSYLCVILEVKNELTSGDPSYQLMRYVQVGLARAQSWWSLCGHTCALIPVLLESLGWLHTVWPLLPVTSMVAATLAAHLGWNCPKTIAAPNLPNLFFAG
jgi:hypothetical protein